MLRASLPFAVLAVFACTGVPAAAAPGGPLGTLPLGHYTCETGGDALGPAGVHQPARDFAVTRGSSYRAATIAGGPGTGVYLLTGDRVVMTAGPFQDQAFRRVREGFLREVGPDGKDTDLRCVRRNGNAR